MLPYSLLGLNLMQIEIFLKCAECNSFSKTAKALQISTSMVSKKIAGLEAISGTVLFERDRNHVVITEAGKLLQRQLERAMLDINNAFISAKNIQLLAEGPLHLGVCQLTNTDRYFIPLLSTFDDSFSFKIKSYLSFDMINELLNGQLDICFSAKYYEEQICEYNQLDSLLIAPSPLYAGLSEDHPLAQKDTLFLEDLKDIAFIMPSPEQNTTYRNWLFALCANHGFIPKEDIMASDGYGVHLNITKNNVFITDKYYRDFHTKYVIFKEIKDTACGILLVWRRSGKSQITKFVEQARVFFNELR